MMHLKKIISIFLASALFVPSIANAAGVEYNTFQKLMNYASQLYIEDSVTVEELTENALSKLLEEKPELLDDLLKAGFSSLDEYSEFYTAEEYEQYFQNLNHTFFGIGVTIQKTGDYIVISNCLEDGSAKENGILPNDRIISVNGEDVVGKSLNEVQQKVVGELNTTVTVGILRGEEILEFTLTRKPVSDTTVYYTTLYGNIGYIEVTNFSLKTDIEFAQALDFMHQKGVSNIILDLRDNPGGYLISAVNIAKLIVPQGIIVQTMFRQEEKNETFYSSLENPEFKFAVLVNQNTASAAEVLSGAMQDSEIGFLIGETTYGKAVIQETFRLANGGFKLTTGHYLTRNGHEINKKGIEPNEYIVNTTQSVDMSKYTKFDYKIKSKISEESDNVLAAKERLRLMGYYFGNINKTFDLELKSAVTKFQENTGLYPYGVLDISTQVRIENEFYKKEELVDLQFYAAYEFFGGNRSDLDKKNLSQE